MKDFFKDKKQEEKKPKNDKSEQRFKVTYSQGVLDCVQIYIDTATGVNYLCISSGGSIGLTPLLDENGKPVITPDIK